MIMIKNKAIYFLLPCSLLFVTCSDDDRQPAGDSQEVRIHASMKEEKTITRADESEDPKLPDGAYYLYLPLGSFNESEQKIHAYTYDDESADKWSTTTSLFWDDLEPATPTKKDTQFYLTNTTETSFDDDITTDDILWGKANGWVENLNFEMKHSMSKFSIVLVDKSIDHNLGLDEAKASLTFGLIRKIESFDFTTGKVTTASEELREEETTLSANQSTLREVDGKPTITLPLDIVPPQDFAKGTKLKITTKKYVFEIDLPAKMKMKDEDDKEVEVDIELRPGEHLTLEIELTEKEMDFTAKLIDWDVKVANPIEVTRVFNIAHWNELKDLMLAINTGYTFKGMVVRLKDDIDVKGQVSLGSEKYPFEGIFDGNGFTINNIGAHDGQGNKGGFFGVTKGATLQNITIIKPEIKAGENDALGGLVDKAEDTTIFNCSILRDGERPGRITGKNDYVGGMVGIGLGKTSLNYCYSIVQVENDGYEYVGGLIGYSEGTITHCSSQGEVTCSGSDFVGGLAGYISNNVLHCFAWGEVNGNSKVGGLIGFVDGSVSNSYASGEVSGNANDSGGLFGNLGFNGTAKYCFWYNPGSVAGTGAATLDDTCEFFTGQNNHHDIIGKLNKGYESNKVWEESDQGQAIFIK